MRIDNYGKISSKVSELKTIFSQNGIEVDERVYTGNDAAFGGWIDYGDYIDRHYSNKQLMDIYRSCRIPDSGILLYDDKITNCCHATSGVQLGIVPYKQRDFIDLSSNSVDNIRKLLKSWKDTPLEGCKYCNGFDPINSPRIPAAEQIK